MTVTLRASDNANLFSRLKVTAPSGDVFELIHAGGDLTGPATHGYRLSTGALFGGPPAATMQEQLGVGVPGARMTPLTHQPRTVVLPVEVLARYPSDLAAGIEELLWALDPVIHDGATPPMTKIEAFRGPGGAVSSYVEAHLVPSTAQHSWQWLSDKRVIVTLTFRCPDPYWQTTAELTAAASIPAATVGEVSAALNVSAGSRSFGVPTWPTFEFETEAVEALTMHVWYSDLMFFTINKDAGGSAGGTINTAPFAQTATFSSGSGSVAGEFFQVKAGSTQVSIKSDASTTSTSAAFNITMTAPERYLTA